MCLPIVREEERGSKRAGGHEAEVQASKGDYERPSSYAIGIKAKLVQHVVRADQTMSGMVRRPILVQGAARRSDSQAESARDSHKGDSDECSGWEHGFRSLSGSCLTTTA